jgi:hypothetical protein
MLHVLVVAEDECVRLTCAEVLTRLGFAASAGDWPPRPADREPDAILVWDAREEDIPAIRAAHGEVPLLVCTWRPRDHWPDSVGIVRLPFNAERVARIVEHTVREMRKLAGHSPR